jgi:MFS family permease
MNGRDSRRWVIVGALFITMFFIWGAINSGAVFFVPILTHFGWSRAKLSVVFSIGWVTGGAAGPLIGWLADRIDPKKMMVLGAAVTGLGWLALSQATSFSEFLALNGLFGVCVGASTVIPCSIIIANWFQASRGLAMGVAFAGSTLGGAAMTVVANYVVGTRGWRSGYAALGTPILVVVLPSIVLLVRSRNRSEAPQSNQALEEVPPDAGPTNIAASMPGLEISEARKTRSFWMIAIAQLLGGLTTGLGPHFIAYLVGVGYSAAFAATVVSAYLIVTTGGTLLGGPLSDRFGARSAMMLTYLLAALGTVGTLTASHPLGLATTIVAGGFAAGALGVQMPLIMIESLGVRRLGSVMGITGIFFTAGAAVSPVITGRIFDLTGSYRIVIVSFIIFLCICALVISGTRSLEQERLRFQLRAQEIAA